MSKAQKSITSFFLPKSNPSKSNEDTNKDDVPKKKLETKNKVEKRKSEEIKNKTPKKFKKDIKLDTISHQQNNISSKKELNKEKLPESEDDDDEWINSKKSKNKILDSDDEDAEEPKNREKSAESPMETTAASSSSESKKNTIPLRKTAARPKKASFEVEKKSPKKEKSEKGAENEKKDTKNNKIIEKEIKDKIKETKTEKTLNGHTSVDDNKQNDKKTLKTEKTRKKEEDDLLYNPSIANYHPINNACWLQDEKMPFIALARTFEEIENTSSRLKTAEILSNLLRSIILLSPQDLSPSLHLCLNRLGPSYEGLELGVGDNLLMKVVAQATGRSMDRIKADVQQKGDLGLVAESSRTTQKTMFKTSKLTVNQVFSKLKLVAAITGHSSTNKKTDSIKHLFVSCRGSEARYLMRSLAGKLRIGLAEQTLLMALAQAFVMHHQYAQDLKELSGEALKKKVDEATAIIKTAYCECPNLTSITDSLLKHPLHELPQHCSIKPGIPLKPMLAHPTKGVHEVMARFEGGEFVCEFKYDGERAQIHMEDGGRKVQIFSRNQENNTTKYPDVIALVQQLLNGNDKVTSAILDAEVVAWDSDKKQILPFQVLSTRKRKDESLESIKVGVCVFAFDLLYLNGEALVRKTLRERRQMFKHLFEFVEGKFSFAKCLESSSTEEIAEFLEESIKGDCEGLMVKSLDKDATYEIAKRSHNWLKLKKDYLEGVGDTIDLVVMGGYHGSGKRAGKFGGFLLGCYDDENEDYQSICKIGTGFSDADLDQHNTFFNEKIIDTPKSYYRHDSSQTPDKWFEACQVWEVKAADLSLSPVYQAAMGLVDSNKGISLRFPRFIRVRDDKKPEDATTSSQIAQMYRSQDQIVNQMKSKKRNEEEEDEY